jgi:DNA-directed RNA polymerase subunit alpha
MSEQHITLPSKPRVVSEKEFMGTYEIDGLYPGYGHTLGNSLRRIILSSLPGTAITHVKIKDVSHEFSTIEGVKEDVITLLLNLKRLRIRVHTSEPQTIQLNAKTQGTVTGKDIDAPGQVEILNPETYIAELSGKAHLSVEMTVASGLGFVPKEAHQKERVDIGAIALDAVFSPIRRVNYEVENMRVGDRTDFNRLRMFIETDGTMLPREALERSIEIMIHQLKAIVGFKEGADETESELPEVRKKKSSTPATAEADKEVMKMRIDELDLSARVHTSLDEAGIRTVGGLARKRTEDILALAGLGQKGLQEIKKALGKHGIMLRD